MEELIVKNISKKFKDLQIFNDLNLNVQKGTITGIIGSNGSGKSVLFKLISGLIQIDSGEILLDNKILSKDFDYLPNTGIFIDSPGFIPYISGFENLKLLGQINNTITEKDIINFMKLLNLDPFSKTKVKNYSFGMKQKLGLIQAIMENQDLILLDEIFNGLDFQSQNRFVGLNMTLV